MLISHPYQCNSTHKIWALQFLSWGLRSLWPTKQYQLLHGTYLAEDAGQLAIVAIYDVLQTSILYMAWVSWNKSLQIQLQWTHAHLSQMH